MAVHAKVELTTIVSSRADRLLAILEVILSVNPLDLGFDQKLLRIVEKVRTALGYPLVSLFYLEYPQKQVVLRAFSTNDAAQFSQKGFVLEISARSAVGICVQKCKPSISKNIKIQPLDPRATFMQGLHTSAALPLFDAEGLCAILEIHSQNALSFSDAEMEMLQILSAQLSIVLQNASLYSEIKHTVARDHQVKQIAVISDEANTAEDVIRQSVQTLSKLMPNGRIAYLTPETRGNLRVRAYAGYAEDESNTLRLKPGAGAAGLVARELKPLLIADNTQKAELQSLSSDSRSILAVPILYAGTLLGIFNIESPLLNSFSEEDLETVTAFTNNLAPILSNFSFSEKIKQQVDRQKQLYEITNKIRQSININTIMRTSIEEICTSLNLPKATIRINPAVFSTVKTPESAPGKEQTL